MSSIYAMSATFIRNGTEQDTTNTETLGDDLYPNVYANVPDLESDALDVDAEGVTIQATKLCALDDLQAAVDSVTIDGVANDVTVAGGMVVISFRQCADAVVAGDDAWVQMEDDVDLTRYGLTFYDGGGLGGPCHMRGVTYTGGSYQQWVRA